jgi:hypothetical protein
MTISAISLRTLVGVLGLGLLSTACIITTSGGDGDDDATDDGTPPATTGLPSDTTEGVLDGTTTSEPSDTTGGPMGECTGNLVLDPGFEGGSPSAAWAEASDVFGTPICNAGCTEEAGAVPYAGDWWAWFGGIEDEPEAASVSQTITIPPEMAYLRFYFQVRSGAGTGDDVFTVTLGGDTVFMATDLDMPDFDAYTRVDIDVSPWADGGSYDLEFASTHTGLGLTSFFLDEVSLVSCSEPGDTGTSTGETEGQDSTGTTTTTTGDTETTGDTGTSGESTDGSTGASSVG